VERAAGRAVQEEFDASMGRLQAQLDSWHAQNVAEKESLIERAQHQRTKADGREAVDAVKRLQQQWKEVGPAPRDQERQLWDEFREQCDAVYQKRQQAHAEYAAGLEANKQQAIALCEEAERFAALPGPALLEGGPGKIAPWRAAFESLGEMPRADQRALHDRFERALGAAQARISQQQAHDKEQAVANLLEAARRIRAYGWAVAQDGASSQRESLKQDAETFIAGVSQWPKGGPQALKDAWAAADAAAPDLEAHEKALRMLCIRSEILTDRPTPPEDQALRREYQVQRLLQHMGRPNEANADDLDALALEWVRVGPVPSAAHESLLPRFLKCR
jgi:hypothetical protein